MTKLIEHFFFTNTNNTNVFLSLLKCLDLLKLFGNRETEINENSSRFLLIISITCCEDVVKEIKLKPIILEYFFHFSLLEGKDKNFTIFYKIRNYILMINNYN